MSRTLRCLASGSIAASLFVALLSVSPARAASVVECSYDSVNQQLDITMNMGVAAAEVRRADTGTAIEVYENGSPIPCNGDQPTVENTDLITAQGVADANVSDHTFTIDVHRPLAPGATAENNDGSEIEISVSLGAGTGETDADDLKIQGGARDNWFVFGTNEINLNPSAESANDDDVKYAEVENLAAYGGRGQDLLDASGEFGTGGGSPLPVTLAGQKAIDSLFSGPAGDTLIGGETREGAGDTVFFIDATGGVSADLKTGVVTGGAGPDDIRSVENFYGSAFGDDLRGNGARNGFHGLGGPDLLRGRGGDDRLDGGDGTDDCAGGAGGDTVLNCET